MNDLNEIYINIKNKLNEYGIDERESRLLISTALNVPKEKLLTLKEISDDAVKKIDTIVDKRCLGVPYAYLTGYKEFMKLNFKVNENVLIPREDTEILVQKAIEILDKIEDEKNVLDMCTGSGCIAVSITKYSNNVKMFAIDISEQALEVAKENAILNNVNITLLKSDLFNGVDKDKKFNMIVSNPPYIKKSVINSLDKEVKEHEPILALDGGEDGLDFYRIISQNAKDYLLEKGYLIFEIGFDQAREVVKILEDNGYKNIEVLKDFSNNDRVVISQT